MGRNLNRIGAFLLYTGSMRQREGEGGIPIRRYVAKAEKTWETLTDEQKRVWKNRAAELRSSELGIRYLITEKRFKKDGELICMLYRDNLFNELLKRCEDLSLFYNC
jgi:hypothetical protein